MALRDYQEEAVSTALWYMRYYSKPFVLQAATGAGKSLMIAEICHRLDEPVLILCPNLEILRQNHSKLENYGIHDIGIYSAGIGQKEIGKFTYATIGTIYKNPKPFKKFKHVIIDEVHIVDTKNLDGMYTKFLKSIGCRNVCGLTATPYRLQQKYVVEDGQTYYTATLKLLTRIGYPTFFRKIVYKIETAELINMGYLSPIKYFVDKVDTRGLVVNSTGRDFTEESLNKFWNDKRLRRIAEAVKYASTHHKRCLVFCSSLRQARNAQALCEGLGIPSLLVDGKTPINERLKAVRDFRSGTEPIIFNVGVFTTGLDVPALDCIVLARPTISLGLYYQMIGRGVRLDPDNPQKELVVYDLVGVTKKLGRVETIRLGKEADGFRDTIESEVGRIDERALFKFHMKGKE